MKLEIPTVKALLESLFKYEAEDEDDIWIQLAIEDRVAYVLSYCNRDDIPARLEVQLLRMICGEFLYQKYLIEGPDAIGIESKAIVNSITVGDEKVDFNTNSEASSEAIFLGHLEDLRKGNRVTLQEFRRLKW